MITCPTKLRPYITNRPVRLQYRDSSCCIPESHTVSLHLHPDYQYRYNQHHPTHYGIRIRTDYLSSFSPLDPLYTNITNLSTQVLFYSIGSFVSIP